MLRRGDVDRVDVKNARRRHVRFRAYPSSGVPGARSKTENERPQFSPQELMCLQELFKSQPPDKRPKIRFEHGFKSRLKGDLGEIVDVEYNELDGWLYVTGKIYEDYVDEVERIVDSGMRGASLSFGTNPNYKQLLEVSLVENPDFEGATVVSYHSADTHWTKKVIFPAIIEKPRMPDEQLRLCKVSDGSYVVPHARYLEPARAHLIEQGEDPDRVAVVDPSMLNNLPDDEREELQAIMLAESRIAGQRTQDEASRTLEQEVEQTYALVKSLTDDTDVSPAVQAELGRTIHENPAASALAKLASERLRERERKIQQLSEENREKDARLKAIVETVDTRVRMHSAGPKRFEDIWAKVVASAKLDEHAKFDANGNLPDRSSSSSSSSSRIFTHSAGGDVPAPRRSEAKRIVEEAPISDAERQIEDQRAKLRRGALDFCPTHIPKPAQADGTIVFTHAVGVKPGSAMSQITRGSTTAEVTNAMVYDIMNGNRDVGVDPRVFRNSLIGTQPELFMEIAESLTTMPLQTNESAGITGWGTPLSETPNTSSSPAICGFSGRRRAFVQTAFDNFGESMKFVEG